MRTFRILLYNVGYATGLDGSLGSYMRGWYRYLYTPHRIIRQVRRSLYALLNKEQPDVCCFVEVHGHHGFVPHPHAYLSHIDNKYGRFSIFRWLPFFRDNCNGFLSHVPLKFQKRYFRAGTKKLVYDIELGNGYALILAHFSLRQDTRRRQVAELKEMIFGRSNVIICGDFNVFKGTRELHSFAESCNLKIVNAHQPTFPAVHPRKAFDLFLCPKELDKVHAEVLKNVHLSDHLPVMLEMAVQ